MFTFDTSSRHGYILMKLLIALCGCRRGTGVRRTEQPGTSGVWTRGTEEEQRMYSQFSEYKVYGASPDCRQNTLYCRPYGNTPPTRVTRELLHLANAGFVSKLLELSAWHTTRCESLRDLIYRYAARGRPPGEVIMRTALVIPWRSFPH